MESAKKNKKMTKGDQPVLQLTRNRATGWLGVFLFVLIWVFLLGILVGRGMAPVNFDIDSLQQELATLRQKLMEKEQRAIERSTVDLTSRSNLEFHEKLKKTEVEPRLPGIKQVQEQEKKEKAATSQRKIPVKTSSLKKQKQPVKANRKKAEQKQLKKYTIQVAALKDAKLSDRLVVELKGKGFPAYRVVAKKSNDVWYRIRVGYYANKTEARPTLRQVKKIHKGAMLVKK